MSCIVNAAAYAENISRLSEDYNIYHEARDAMGDAMGLQLYSEDAGHLGCHDYSRVDASLPHSMLDTCCNNWQNVVKQNSRVDRLAHNNGMAGRPTETLDIMLVEYFELTNKPKAVSWPKGTQKILPIGM